MPVNPVVFKLSTDYIELAQLLKAAGFCESGGAAKCAIAGKLVKVDGELELRRGRKIRLGQRVEYAEQIITVE